MCELFPRTYIFHVLHHIKALCFKMCQIKKIRQSCFSLQPGHYPSLTTPNPQPTGSQELKDQCGNQHYSREVLMMGIVVPEVC